MNKENENEFVVGVAAAAYAINSLEEEESQYRDRIKIERSRQDTRTRVSNSDRVARGYSSKEIKTTGETSSRKSMEQDHRRQSSSLPTSKPGRSSSASPMTAEVGERRRNGNSKLNVAETKADAWEKAELEKLNKRCEKKKASILAWENIRKQRAKVKMERRKKDLEQRIKRNQLFYQAKTARIDHIAAGARAQVDEKRRNEEMKIKEKARKIRASGKVPVTCFCF